MQSAYPYLNFRGNAEEAFDFYRTVFGGDFSMLIRFKDMGGNATGIPESERNNVAHVALPIGDAMLMASDVVGAQAESLRIGNNVYISLTADSAEEAARVFEALAAGGRVDMPLQQTEWAEKFGICVDRFGVQWMMAFTGNVQFEVG